MNGLGEIRRMNAAPKTEVQRDQYRVQRDKYRKALCNILKWARSNTPANVLAEVVLAECERVLKD